VKKFLLCLAVFLLCGSFALYAQTGGQFISFDFVEQQIREILYAFSTYARVSIIGDDTVTGTANFQYNGTNFEQAFDSFLMANRLFVEKTSDVWIVSRVNISVNNNGRIILDSYDATPAQLMDKLTRKTSATILQDILPSTRLSLHLDVSNAREAVELIMKPFPDYAIEAAAGYIQIVRTQTPIAPLLSAGTGYVNIFEYNNVYEVDINQARLADVLDRLFQTAGREYISFIRPDQTISRARFSNKNLPDTLTIILEQAGGEYREINSLYYIFPLQQSDIISSLRNENKTWERFETKYRLVQEIMPYLQARFGTMQTITLADNNTFLSFVDAETAAEINNFIKSVDIPYRSEAIRLRFIKTEDLYRSLPPTARREDLIDAGDGNTFFFTGSDERRALFLKDLEIIDRPQPRIRYDLFIIQVQDSTNLNWSAEAEARSLRPGDRSMVTGMLGNLLSLNFDIIAVFGYQFAAKLNVAIAENQASVFADTTLFGLSGQEIKFQNTSTYRYRDSNIDPETGRPIYSGVTREIVSGLLLEIRGWVSGDGMITTSVTASVSKRGADVSSSTGNPPPTSERVLTTHVRARSGETVVLSGLRQNDSTIVEQRTPFISKVPVLGWLFTSKNNTVENTQIIIYLVPHVDLVNDEYAIDGLRTASIFNRFVEPYLE